MVARRSWLWLSGWGLALWCSVAAAQTFYKWTDERGVVHFADSPPSDARHVEERNLPAPPAVRPREEAPGESDAAKGEAQTLPAQGPAQVIVSARKTPRTGPSAMHVGGQVKNVGGTDAQRVAVTITVLEDTQKNPCLSEEVAVKPSTLRPGESGDFDADLNSPCLFGDSSVELAPVWD